MFDWVLNTSLNQFTSKYLHFPLDLTVDTLDFTLEKLDISY